jgi:hypothetical protein
MDYDPIALGQRIRLAYAEHLLRCTDPPPSEMEELLSLDGDLEQAWRWLAFGIAKRRYDPAEVRGLLIYLFSNYYPPLVSDPAKGRAAASRSQQQDYQAQRAYYRKAQWDISRLAGCLSISREGIQPHARQGARSSNLRGAERSPSWTINGFAS